MRCNSCRLRHRPVSRVAMGMHPRWKLDIAQLVATAAYVDPDFVQKAVRLVADHSTYFKSIVPLAETSRRARLNRAGRQHGGSQSARGSHDRQRQLRHHRLGLASEPARSLRVDVSTAGLNDSFEALKSHRRKTALGRSATVASRPNTGHPHADRIVCIPTRSVAFSGAKGRGVRPGYRRSSVPYLRGTRRTGRMCPGSGRSRRF